MTNDIKLTDITERQQQLIKKLEIPNNLLSRLKNVSEDQKNTIQDVLALIYPSTEDGDFGAKSLMSINVAILSTVIEDVVKNFNFSSGFYDSDGSRCRVLVDSLCKVMKVQNDTLKQMKQLSLVGVPQLHIHQHARGVPSFNDNTVLVVEGVALE
jgi:hypothetical protein